MVNQLIQDRLSKLRSKMSALGIDYFLIPTADFHNSEYVAPYFQTREYFCGFSGSNGTLVVGLDETGLWTDGRYFIQAEKELRGTGVDLYREQEEGVPTVTQWLADRLRALDKKEKASLKRTEESDSYSRRPVLAFDGRCIAVNRLRDFQKKFEDTDVYFVTDVDPAEGIWNDRPKRPSEYVFVLEEKYTGESAQSRLKRLREKMRAAGAGIYVENKLDNLMWLLNLRGNDVECTPVALSYGVFTEERQILFLQDSAVTPSVREYAKEIGLELFGYEDVCRFLEDPALYLGTAGPEGGAGSCRVLFHPGSLSCRLYEAFQKGRDAAFGSDYSDLSQFDIEKRSPVEDFKAVKNAVELENIRACYREDSAAVCRFLYWLHRHMEEGTIDTLTELDAERKMDSLRAQISDFIELSFGTISAYGPNAAMMHYSAKEDDCAQLRPEGMLLMDCGGQYLRGTTDVTRTMALGPVTEEMRRHYTLTAVGNLQLMDAVFLRGCSGRNLDILAREPLWRSFADYKCGTGHGIGYLLSVHEGPHSIRWRFAEGTPEAVLVPGMIVSDEPGVYIEGQYGIRIETILEVIEAEKNADGSFLRFAPLTLVPLDPALIDPAFLTPRAREVLNEYHRRVYAEIAPFLTQEERTWLRTQTQPL